MADMAFSDNGGAPLEFRTGLVTVFTGDGKGKTTAAIGTAVRAAGHGLKVSIVFFLKGKMFSQGEVNSIGLLSNIDVSSFGVNDWLKKGEVHPAAVLQARQALAASSRMIESKKYDLVIMDEVNSAVDFGLISAQDVLNVLQARPLGVDLLLTGRNADQRVIEASDIVTEMKCVKHAYERGIEARQGIDY